VDDYLRQLKAQLDAIERRQAALERRQEQAEREREDERLDRRRWRGELQRELQEIKEAATRHFELVVAETTRNLVEDTGKFKVEVELHKRIEEARNADEERRRKREREALEMARAKAEIELLPIPHRNTYRTAVLGMVVAVVTAIIAALGVAAASHRSGVHGNLFYELVGASDHRDCRDVAAVRARDSGVEAAHGGRLLGDARAKSGGA
jgi:hypothetical protein